MISLKTFLTLILGLTVGACFGFWIGNSGARLAVRCGPYSDEFGSALNAINAAESKLESGNTDVIEHIHEARERIQRCKEWTNHYIDETDKGE